MILGLLLGVLAPNWKVVAFGALAAIVIRFAFFFADGGNASILAWNETAAMVAVAYVSCALVGFAVYGLKRVLKRPARRENAQPTTPGLPLR